MGGCMRVVFVVGVAPEITAVKCYSEMSERHELYSRFCHEINGVALLALNGFP